MDLNADFDSLSAAGLFLNSSHGVGAELGRSGVNGPSIYPVSALGIRLNVALSQRWAVRYALTDGVPGDPARPRALVIARLAPSEGTFSIGEVDYRAGDRLHVAVGAWNYSHAAVRLDDRGLAHRRGAHAEIEGALSDDVQARVRVGTGNGAAQNVQAYLGAGIVFKNRYPAGRRTVWASPSRGRRTATGRAGPADLPMPKPVSS